MLFAVLLATALSISCIASVSAADVGTAQSQAANSSTVQENVEMDDVDIANGTTTQNSAINSANDDAAVENSDNTTSTITQTSSTQQEATVEAAAPVSFTINQIDDAAARVKTWIETNHNLPNYVTIGTTQVKMPDFLKLLTACLLQINSGTTTPITLKTVKAPVKPIETVKSGNITKSGYLDTAKRVNTFIDTNGIAPNYATSTLGNIRYESLIYMFSKILNFHKANNNLPNYVTVAPWSTTPTDPPIPPELQKYLQATANCQVNNAEIKAQAAAIIAGTSNRYDKAVKIFNWVRDKTSYQFYYNTKKGAVNTLKSKSGNCCDLSHLLIALTRAAGIPARYVHANCKFKSGWIGHVYAQVWVNGKWYTADASNNINGFGVARNWNQQVIKGTYASLPF